MDERKWYYDKWITTVMGCNNKVGPKKTTAYAKRPVGNSPEIMPLDNSINQDVHESVRVHTVSTFYLPKDHQDKFSLSTPKSIIHAY